VRRHHHCTDSEFTHSLQCGMARFPNTPFLLVMYANFLLETRKDGQAARTQVQLAQKNSPTFIDRYFIYVSQELAKRLKNDGDTLDLMGYIEFQRNYRCGVNSLLP